MTFNVDCPGCGQSLKVPEEGRGRKLRCPKCGNRFRDEKPVGTKTAAAGSGGRPASPSPSDSGPSWPTQPGDDRSASSTFMAATFRGDEGLPAAPGPLRETFDPTLLDGQAASADASALFLDDGPGPIRPRRNLAAERSKARRCPTCGAGVPAGTSLCNTCGLDLETGIRPAAVEPFDLDEPPPTPRQPAPDPGALVVGGGGLIAGVVMAVSALLSGGSLALLAGLGLPGALLAYASARFLTGRSAQLLFVALGLAAAVDLTAMIALPLYETSAAPAVVRTVADGDADETDSGLVIAADGDRLDLRRVKTGIALLGVTALAAIYLTTPAARRHARRTP